MTYLEAVALIKKIEQKHDMMLVKYKGVSVWPLLRINIIDAITGNNVTMKSTGVSAVKQVLSTLFYYNPLNGFCKHKVWLFTAYERRKIINGRKILRVSGCVTEAEPDTLVIEKPSPDQWSHPRSEVPEKAIVSESWLLFMVHALAILSKPFSIKLEKEKLLRDVLDGYGIKFDYVSSLKVLISQKQIFDVVLAFLPKPKKVIIECPYTIMGYVWSLHEHGIPVIELQHGVLNDKHYAYNSEYRSNELYPDTLCVFGDDEYNYMQSDGCYYCKDVRKTGLYYMELAKNSFQVDPFAGYRSHYKHIVLVAGQRGYEDQMAKYVREAAKVTSECLYVYVPRNTDAGLSFKAPNIVYRPGINIYGYMIWCDLHLTISSTTCLECQYYHKPTIFYNYSNMSKSYYRSVLTEDNGAVFTNDVKEYGDALKKVLTQKFEFKEVFALDTINCIKKIINE